MLFLPPFTLKYYNITFTAAIAAITITLIITEDSMFTTFVAVELLLLLIRIFINEYAFFLRHDDVLLMVTRIGIDGESGRS